jgi:hypothetical protein
MRNAKKAKLTKAGKRIGRPRTGSRGVYVRVPPLLFNAIDAWVSLQPAPRPTLPEALRRLAERALACEERRS